MAHGKLYRSFIILQEDERGHSTSNDKPLSGYAKVEAKGEKCKIAFYAQNLKADYGHCQMVLVCNKKDGKYNVNLGPVNISPQGKAEMSVEYDANNIGDFGVSYDKIVGASLCKEIAGKTVFLMCGFLNGEQPKDNWKNYKMMAAKKDDKKSANVNKEANKTSNVNKEVNKNTQVNTDNKKQEHKANNKATIENNNWTNNNHENMANNNWGNNNHENMANNNWANNNHENMANNNWANNNHENMANNNWANNNHENMANNNMANNNNGNIANNQWGNNNNNWNNNSDEHKHHHHQHEHHNSCCDGRDDYESKFDDYEREIDEANRYDEENFELRGSMGEFFNSVVDEFELTRGFTKEIKNCKWYKVKVNDFDDMCNASHYNKYTVVYYPMINYYPYISKHGHFMIGLKCDNNGVVKYVVYGIPGTKDKKDQPYGGKTGFVTWCPDNKREDSGHWLMFYDFQNSMVVIPMK